MDIYKVPTCCSCHIMGYSYVYPPLKRGAPSAPHAPSPPKGSFHDVINDDADFIDGFGTPLIDDDIGGGGEFVPSQQGGGGSGNFVFPDEIAGGFNNEVAVDPPFPTAPQEDFQVRIRIRANWIIASNGLSIWLEFAFFLSEEFHGERDEQRDFPEWRSRHFFFPRRLWRSAKQRISQHDLRAAARKAVFESLIANTASVSTSFEAILESTPSSSAAGTKSPASSSTSVKRRSKETAKAANVHFAAQTHR